MSEAFIEYVDEDTAKVFRWHGGPRIDVGRYERTGDDGFAYQAEDVLDLRGSDQDGSAAEMDVEVPSDTGPRPASIVRIETILTRFEDTCRGYLRIQRAGRDLVDWAGRVESEATEWQRRINAEKLFPEQRETLLLSFVKVVEEARDVRSIVRPTFGRAQTPQAVTETIVDVGLLRASVDDESDRPFRERDTTERAGWATQSRSEPPDTDRTR